MSKERFLTLIDAIIAIIATIMVLDLPRPEEMTLAGFSKVLVPLFVYALSFFMICGVWLNHHTFFEEVKRVNTRIYWLNIIWVFLMSLFPYVTALAGAHPMSQLAEFSYLLVTTCWALLYDGIVREVRKENPQLSAPGRTYFGKSKYLNYWMIGAGFLLVWIWPPYVLLLVLFLTVSIGVIQWRRTKKRA